MTFESSRDLAGTLQKCASGIELSERGFSDDVAMAAQIDVDGRASLLKGGAFSAE